MKFKIEIKKLKIRWSVKYAYIIIAALVVGIIGFLSVFLYKNFYQTITYAKEIIVLKEKVAPETVNLEKFNEVLDKIEKKVTPETIDWQGIKNPFIFHPSQPVILEID